MNFEFARLKTGRVIFFSEVAGLNRAYSFKSGSVLEALGGVESSLSSEKEALISAEVRVRSPPWVFRFFPFWEDVEEIMTCPYVKNTHLEVAMQNQVTRKSNYEGMIASLAEQITNTRAASGFDRAKVEGLTCDPDATIIAFLCVPKDEPRSSSFPRLVLGCTDLR